MSQTNLSQDDSEATDLWFQTAKEAAVAPGAVSGILVAIMWVAGRTHFRFYFRTMNMPINHVQLSVWEYAEWGGPWFLGTVGLTFSLGMIAWVSLPVLYYHLKEWLTDESRTTRFKTPRLVLQRHFSWYSSLP
jgi:hypothetical protein